MNSPYISKTPILEEFINLWICKMRTPKNRSTAPKWEGIIKALRSSAAKTKKRTEGGRERSLEEVSMANPSLSLKFAVAFAFSFSLTISSSSSFPFSSISFPKKPPFLSLKSSSSPSLSTSQNLASDLLSLLGSKQDAARVPADEAAQLRSCLKFLVPFPPSHGTFQKLREVPQRRALHDQQDQLVLWPPPPVMELARLAVDSGGDPAAIQRSLDPTPLPVPDVEGLAKDKCELTRTPYGRRFVNQELNSYLAMLFEMIAERAPLVGFNVSLSRYDLFHGHIFLASNSGRLGILFHAKEYPAYDKEVFPYNLGYCQTGSDVVYNDSINLRNILWLAPLPSNVTKAWVAPGTLVVLDAHPEGIIYKELIPEYVDVVRTVYEDDFGELVADVNYLNVGNAAPANKIFIC